MNAGINANKKRCSVMEEMRTHSTLLFMGINLIIELSKACTSDGHQTKSTGLCYV